MNTVVKARHMEVTDAMREHLEGKLGKLPRYYNNIMSIEAILDMEGGQALVEIVVTARKKHTFVATSRHDDMYACIDKCLDKISEQIRRHKDKVRARKGAHANPVPSQEQ